MKTTTCFKRESGISIGTRIARAALLLGLGASSVMTAGAGSLIETTPFYNGDESVYTGKVEDRLNLWPLVYYREPMFSALWPLLSVTHDHVALRPFFAYDKRENETRVLWPLVTLGEEEGHIITWYWKKNENSCWPFYRYATHGDTSDFWMLPGIYSTAAGSYGWFPLFHRSPQTTGAARSWVACGLAGHENWNGETVKHWFFPFYGYNQTGEERSSVWTALGLAGWEKTCGKVAKHWFFPFYKHEASKQGATTSLACGVAGWERADGQDRSWFFPFYKHEALKQGTSTSLACGLAGWKRENGKDRSWFFPFYDRETTGDTTSTWLACGLVHWSGDTKLDDRRKQMETVRQAGLDAVAQTAGDQASETAVSRKVTQVFPLFEREEEVSDNPKDVLNGRSVHRFRSCQEHGVPLLTTAEDRSVICFDNATKEKVKDERAYGKKVLNVLYRSEGKEDRLAGKSEETRSVLWRLYHAREEDGNTSVDLFPGFTRDTRTDGYVRTSFLWRFFRYESDPTAGTTKLDLCFIPVKR